MPYLDNILNAYKNTYQPYYNSRLKRGLKQKMFLLDVDQNKNNWKFKVKGTTNDYDLNINDELISCSCPDFKKRGNICKHLYFIIGRIAQNEDLAYDLEKEIEESGRGSILTDDELKIVSDNLISRLTKRINETDNKSKDNGNIDINCLEDDCSICFESLKDGVVIQCCEGGTNTCKNYFHKVCIGEWLGDHNTCPLCRRAWKIKHEIDYDPFDRLDTKKIKLK